MGRAKSSENAKDPATGRTLSPGVGYRGPGQYRARKLVGGKPVTKTFETDKLAREWREETEAKVRADEYVDRRSLDKSTVAQLVQRFVDERMQDGGERRGAAEDRGHIPALTGDAIGALPLSKLTPASVREFRDRQTKAGFAKGTIVKRMNLLAAIISHARSEWDIPLPENAASGESVKRPKGADKKRNRRLKAPSAADILAAAAAGDDPPKHEEQRMLEALADSPYPHDVLITRWAIAQAMRQGESIALVWGDIDLDRKVVEVYGRHRIGTKTADDAEELGPERRPLMPDALAILREIKGDRNPKATEAVFNVGPQDPFKVRWGRMITKSGLLDLTYHDLRHEATSRLAKKYKNPNDLMRVTGHKDLKSLNRYYHPDLTELADMAAAD